jgi:hypothetical protein
MRWIVKPPLVLKDQSEWRTDCKMRLSTQLYHRKHMMDFFSVYGSQKEGGLIHMLELLSILHADNNAKPYVNFPVTIRSSSQGNSSSDELIFPKLRDYKIGGFPEDADECKKIVDAVRTAIGAINAAGVVHVDFYVSNWMWKKDETGDILIKVIDWDSAHAVDEGLTDEVQNRLKYTYGTGTLLGDAKVATAELDTVYVDVLEANMTSEKLRASTKPELDHEFSEMCHEAWK